jgi:predicted nucleic acid-binding protein
LADEPTYVFDACAVITLLEGEPGAEVVESILQQDEGVFLLHAINACEVFYHTYRRAGEKRARGLKTLFRSLRLTLDSNLPPELWEAAGTLKAAWRRVSVADCVALALAMDHGGTLVTSDHHELDRIAEAGICPIRFIR